MNRVQDDKGLKSFLRSPNTYSLFQRFVGLDHARRWVSERYLRVDKGAKVVDIGCGPADLLEFLSAPTYVGIDISTAYIEAGRLRYPSATFLPGTTDDYRQDPRVSQADLVICFGVMHHLDDDEAMRLLTFAHDCLKPRGRFVALEPCRLVHQAKLSAWVMSLDRGKNVRFEGEWRQLLHDKFRHSATSVLTGLMRIPYTHIVLEGVREGE